MIVSVIVVLLVVIPWHRTGSLLAGLAVAASVFAAFAALALVNTWIERIRPGDHVDVIFGPEEGRRGVVQPADDGQPAPMVKVTLNVDGEPVTKEYLEIQVRRVRWWRRSKDPERES
jgi:hypothetical protein